MRISLLFLVSVLAAGCSSGQSSQPIYLGHVATTSGPDRAVGEQEVLGIRLAIEELAREGINRVGERPIFVKHADAHGDESAWESEAVRLVSVGRVAALYGGNTAGEVQRLERGRAPVLTPLGTRPRGSSDLVFGIGAPLADEAYALARFAVFEKDARSAAILVDERREEARALADAFADEFQKAALEKHGKDSVTKPERISLDKEPDWKALEQRLGVLKNSVVLFAGSSQDFGDWRKGSSVEQLVLFGGDVTSLRATVPAFVVSAFAVHKELPKTETFAKKFRETFKEEPTVHAALAYDGVRILIDAMRRAQSSEKLLDEMRQTKEFAGLTGPVSFGADQQMRRPVFVGRVTGSVFTSVKKYDPRN